LLVVLLFLSFLFLVSLLVVVVVLLLLLPLLLLVLSLFVAFELWRCRSLAVGSLTPPLPPSLHHTTQDEWHAPPGAGATAAVAAAAPPQGEGRPARGADTEMPSLAPRSQGEGGRQEGRVKRREGGMGWSTTEKSERVRPRRQMGNIFAVCV